MVARVIDGKTSGKTLLVNRYILKIYTDGGLFVGLESSCVLVCFLIVTVSAMIHALERKY